jgi:hypothetical protein
MAKRTLERRDLGRLYYRDSVGLLRCTVCLGPAGEHAPTCQIGEAVERLKSLVKLLQGFDA